LILVRSKEVGERWREVRVSKRVKGAYGLTEQQIGFAGEMWGYETLLKPSSRGMAFAQKGSWCECERPAKIRYLRSSRWKK